MKCHYQIDRVANQANTFTIFVEPENPAEVNMLMDAGALVGDHAKYGVTSDSLFIVIPLRYR